MGAGTFNSMGPSTALKEGLNGQGQVGIPSSLQEEHGLDALPLLLCKASNFAAQATPPTLGGRHCQKRQGCRGERHIGEACEATLSTMYPVTAARQPITHTCMT
jgi:hypothetical protein